VSAPGLGLPPCLGPPRALAGSRSVPTVHRGPLRPRREGLPGRDSRNVNALGNTLRATSVALDTRISGRLGRRTCSAPGGRDFGRAAGCDAGRALVWTPGGFQRRIFPLPSAGSARRRRGASSSIAGIDGRYTRPSIGRTRAPVRRTARRRRARGFSKHFRYRFREPSRGAGARATRAPDRPRWVETRFRPRRAPGLRALWRPQKFPRTNH